MNYKKMLLNTIDEINEENSDDTKNIYVVKAKELIKTFLIEKFNDKELIKIFSTAKDDADKEENHNKFIAERILIMLNYYIEGFYLIDNDIFEENLIIREEMRLVNNFLRNKLFKEEF